MAYPGGGLSYKLQRRSAPDIKQTVEDHFTTVITKICVFRLYHNVKNYVLTQKIYSLGNIYLETFFSF